MDAIPRLVRPHFASDLDLQAALLTVRLCLGFSDALSQLNDSMSSEDLRQMVGIAPFEGKITNIALRPLLKIRAKEFEQQHTLRRSKTVLSRNSALLSELLELDRLQSDIIVFAALSHEQPLLAEVVESIRTTSRDTITRLLATALHVTCAEVSTALRPGSPLQETGILSIEQSVVARGLQVSLLPSLRTALFTPADSIETLMQSFLELAPRPTLKTNDFEHLRRETDLLTAYLSKASSNRAAGVNVLIYGVPGTGKTEYVRWLVTTHFKKNLYQVRATDDNKKSITGLDRLVFFQLSQRFLKKVNAIMLFDEMEDAFPSGENIFTGRPVAGKMFLNRLLESNPIPTIWIANAVSRIDRAYLRRFDFSFEMGIPPIAVRRRILIKHLRGHKIPSKTISYLSQQEELSPAQIEKAAKVLKWSGEPPENKESTLLLVVENSMSLLAQEKNDTLLSLSECRYSLEFLNADCDLQRIVARLKQAPQSAVGALCLYGASGTGKTAFAHYLAREIELPLLVRRASDILSPYIGETEQKIALMFRQARQEGALLLLDEADSFLADRQSANNSWEITAVNEMLTQIERHDGLFICSTNLMQRLDSASLRRFALKIKFDYLRPEQRWRLFLDQAKKFHRIHEAHYRAALNTLTNLTPGDFATIRRQAVLLNVALTAEELLHRLQKECRGKASTGQPIGFIHSQ